MYYTNLINIENSKYPPIVCYFTIGTYYEVLIKKLITSLERFKINYVCYGILSYHSWLLNTGYKAEFIKYMCKKLKTCFIWLDADSCIFHEPGLFKDWLKSSLDSECSKQSIGVYLRDKFPNVNLNSSIIYFKNDTICKFLVNEWCKTVVKHKYQVWDQKCLEYVYVKYHENFFTIPKAYAKKKEKKGIHIICQYQISNKIQDKIDCSSDPLRYICSNNKLIEDVNTKEVTALEDLENYGKSLLLMKLENINTNENSEFTEVLRKDLYSFNPYIFAANYIEYIDKFKSKESCKLHVIDINKVYMFYILNKNKLNLSPNKYNLDHYFAIDLLKHEI